MIHTDLKTFVHPIGITGYKNGETTLILPKFQILAFDITSWQTKGHQYYFWPFSSGRNTAYNVTVINPLRRDYMEGSAENPGYGVQQAYKTKWNSYGPACEREGMNFVPLPVDVFGAWHVVAIKHLKTGCYSESYQDIPKPF